MKSTKNTITGINTISVIKPITPPTKGAIARKAINFANLTAYSLVTFFTDALRVGITDIFLNNCGTSDWI